MGGAIYHRRTMLTRTPRVQSTSSNETDEEVSDIVLESLPSSGSPNWKRTHGNPPKHDSLPKDKKGTFNADKTIAHLNFDRISPLSTSKISSHYDLLKFYARHFDHPPQKITTRAYENHIYPKGREEQTKQLRR